MNCSLHPQALAEYREAAPYYGRQAPGLGEAFTNVVEAAIANVKASPRARAADARKVRRCPTRRFPYLIQYVIEQASPLPGEEFITIYAIHHFRRDGTYWLHRLPS